MASRWIAVGVALVAHAACGEAGDLATAPTSSPVEPTRLPPVTAVESAETRVVPTTAGSTSLPVAPSTIPGCDEVPTVEAPGGWYRDGPVYVGTEQPVEEVRAWAGGRPGYQDIWLDRKHFGWITVAFSEDATTRQAELEAEFPGVGVVAVEVPTTSAELVALQERAHQLLVDAGVEFAGSGSYVDRWVVGLDVNVADERVAAALAPLAGERICLSATGVPVPAGPQPDAGEGWRLLGDELVGETYRTDVATTDERYRALWRRVGMTAERPSRRLRR